MLLIVESGATKSDWRAVSKDGKEMKKIIAEGVNVSTMRSDTIKNIISETADQLAQDKRPCSKPFHTCSQKLLGCVYVCVCVCVCVCV